MSEILNASSKLVNRGVLDLSGRQQLPESTPIPQHLPIWMIFAATGDEAETLADANGRLNNYGTVSFQEGSKYFTHQTLFANRSAKTGNMGVYKRLIPKDAGPKPTILVSADVLETMIDDYERNTDGSIKLNGLGMPTVVGQIPGVKIKYVRHFFPDAAAAEKFGAREISEGDQIDGTVKSVRIPIFDYEHSFIGETGNLSGIRIWPVDRTNTVELPTTVISRNRAYPFNFAVIRKNTRTGSAEPQDSLMSEKYITGMFKTDAKDITGANAYLGKKMVSSYNNTTDARYGIVKGDFGRVFTYQKNIEDLQKLIHSYEKPFINGEYDFTAADTEFGMINFLTGTDTRKVPYHSMVFVDSPPSSIRFSQTSNIYAEGGSDGTMTLETFNQLVSEYIVKYADPNSELTDIAYHVQNYVYDSGFDLETKFDLMKFIAVRKDTSVHLGTRIIGEPELTASEEVSMGIALKNMIEMYPESTYFNTPVFRGTVFGQSAQVRNSNYETPVSLLYEVVGKLSEKYGAASGAWDNEKAYDGFPGHLVNDMTEPSITFISESLGTRFWDVNVNFVRRFDRDRFYFPSYKTVYSDDTSVLTSIEAIQVISTVTRVLNQVHREMSGKFSLTEAQFSATVNDRIVAKLQNKFSSNVVIIPRAQFTSMDQIRGFSWTVPVDVYLPNMKTVMSTWIVTRRLSDLGAA